MMNRKYKMLNFQMFSGIFLIKHQRSYRYVMISRWCDHCYQQSQPPDSQFFKEKPDKGIFRHQYIIQAEISLQIKLLLKLLIRFDELHQIEMINEKGIYGLISGVITTTILQPFQNIKMALMIPPYKLQEAHKQNGIVSNILSSSKYIYEHSGPKGFYKGLVAASLKAALGCYIYFTGLRYFESIHDSTLLNNFLVSSASRLASTFLTNPLNIIETRFQLAFFQGYSSVWSAAVDIYKKQGLKGFFSGGLSSCIKQGTFGGFHYMCYQEMKNLGFDKVVSGIASGVFATAITHPFQIIRARLQTIGLTENRSFSQHLIIWQLKEMKKNGGWFAGLAPRLIKKPIANMLTFLMFQIFQDSKKASINQ